MDLREQSYILAIAKYGSIKPAAEELHISPPTLSIFLSSLENNIGIRLFDRLGKRFIPTQAGRLYISTAQDMINLRNSYEAELSDLRNGVTGTISFGIQPRRTLYLLASALKEFTELYPDVQVNTCEETSDIAFPLLLKGELDFIINHRVLNEPMLTYTPFYQDHLVLVLPADHPLADRGVMLPGETTPWIDLALFKDERMVLQQPDQSSRVYTDKALNYSQVKPKHVFKVSNLESAAQLAAEGLCISFNFESYIRYFSYPKPVRYFYVGDPKETINYYIICRKDKYMANYTQTFITLLKKYISF